MMITFLLLIGKPIVWPVYLHVANESISAVQLLMNKNSKVPIPYVNITYFELSKYRKLAKQKTLIKIIALVRFDVSRLGENDTLFPFSTY